MTLTKKQLERHTLERFRASFTDFPDGAVAESEEPDFLIATPQGIVGIELTTLHAAVQPGVMPPHASEAMRWRVVERAQALYVAAGHPPVSCAVQMRSGHIEKADVERLAIAIVDIAMKNLPEPGASVRAEFDWINRDSFPDELISVMVHRPIGRTKSFFQCPGASWVAPLTASDIERVIAPKDGKYRTYRRRCDTAWLIISADTTTMATWFQFDAPPPGTVVKTRFDRVFLMRHFGGSVNELAVTNDGIRQN